MDVKPILFNTEMVREILEGRKTVTRRVVKPQPAGDGSAPEPLKTRPGYWNSWGDDNVYRPPYQPGDILWVRETWRIQSAHRFEADAKIEYKAGGPMGKVKFKCRSDYDCFIWNQPVGEGKWKPSIHMPREAARIFLRVTGVRVERLQDMRLKDCEKEGVQLNFVESADLVMGSIRARERFSGVWDSTIKPKDLASYGWNANPWVWVFDFERISKEEAQTS